MRVTDNGWELDHELSIPGERSVWKMWDGEKLHIRTDYPTAELVRQNADTRSNWAGQKLGDIAPAARIPLNVYHASGLAEAAAQGDDKFRRRWLNNSDNRDFLMRDASF